MFIVIEGPNGIGKTTISEALASLLEGRLVLEVLLTREPSDSPLGQSIRAMQDQLAPEALAMACVADRLDHYAREIAPMRKAGGWVICDRYVPSSLVLQRLDGLELDRIWMLNASVVAPDLTIYLADQPAVIEERLAARPRLSRLEVAGGPARELDLYDDARRFLDQRGWRSRVVDCHARSAEQIAVEITDELVAG